MMNVLVLEPGTFKLSGVVSDSSGGMISGVTVEVLSGTGKGLKATTDSHGQYAFMEWPGPCRCAHRPTALQRKCAMSSLRETTERNRLLSHLWSLRPTSPAPGR